MLLLASLAWFRNAPRERLVLLAHHARERNVKKGTVLYEPGVASNVMWIIVDGQVRIERNGRRVATAVSGWGIGALEVMANREPSSRAIAEKPTYALCIPTHVLHDLMDDHFEFGLGALRNFARGLLEMTDKLPFDRDFSAGEDPPDWEVGEPPFDFVQRLALVRRGELIRDASFESVARIARSLTTTTYAPGEIVWRRGEPSGRVMTVVSGAITAIPAHDRWRAKSGPFGTFGALPSFAGLPTYLEVTAVEPTVIMSNETESLIDVLEDDGDLMRHLLQTLGGRYLDVQDAVAAAQEGDLRPATAA